MLFANDIVFIGRTRKQADYKLELWRKALEIIVRPARSMQLNVGQRRDKKQ